MRLRPYQEAAVRRVREEWRTHRAVLLVSPTGSGKTATGAAIVLEAVLAGERVLWLAHRDELVSQATDAIARVVGAADVGTVTAEAMTAPEVPVQVASLQTLLARGQRPEADLVVLDEAHHAAATTFRGLLSAYPQTRILGLTATPQRGDGRALVDFGAMVVAATPTELVTAGHLVPMEIIRPAKQLRAGQIARDPLDAYRGHANGRPALVFCSSVKHATEVATRWSESGIPAACVHADTGAAERAEAIAAFRSGALTALTNVAILTEGTDLPRASCAILARGCGTTALYLQIAGRIARPSPDKRDALLIDLRGVSHTHGHPYDPREYSLDGRGISRPVERPDQSYCRVCGAPIDLGDACTDCGTGPLDRPVKVVNAALVKFAAVRRRDAAERAAHYRRLILKCRAAGWKPGRADHIYNATYGEWPGAEIRRLALAST